MELAAMTSRDASGPLWAITAYFNPMGWQRRLANYRTFRQRLALPLVTVELGYHPEFELKPGDAEVLVQHRGHDVLWQKERLLNLALEALPPGCRAVAWLDCDVVFADEEWSARALRQLERFTIVQAFQEVADLGRDSRLEEMTQRPADREGSAFRVMTRGNVSANAVQLSPVVAPGLAWAGRREVLQKHGFYDAYIVGGADRGILAAAYGSWTELAAVHRLNPSQQQHYFTWATPFFNQIQGNVGFVEGRIANLWHGENKDRAYVARFERLACYQFDPFRDIALDSNRCWRWNSSKPELHEFVRGYFAQRQEDGG
jgi:hypothetical protein